MNTMKWALYVATLCTLCLCWFPASAVELSLCGGASMASPDWLNEQLDQYGVEYRESLAPIRSAFQARLDVGIPELRLWRFYPVLGFDMRMASRSTQGGPYSAGMIGVSIGSAIPMGERLTMELAVVVYRGTYDSPPREGTSLSGWGVGGRLGVSYEIPLTERFGLEIGILGDLARVVFAGGRESSDVGSEINLSGIGVSIGVTWRGG